MDQITVVDGGPAFSIRETPTRVGFGVEKETAAVELGERQDRLHELGDEKRREAEQARSENSARGT